MILRTSCWGSVGWPLPDSNGRDKAQNAVQKPECTETFSCPNPYVVCAEMHYI